MSEEDAFWAAIDANPGDSLVRGVFADWLDERGDQVSADTAAGLRATAEYVPDKEQGDACFAWFSQSRFLTGPHRLPADLFGKLSGQPITSSTGGPLTPQEVTEKSRLWRDYPSARAAVADVVRAWVRVEREKGKVKCRRCGGTGRLFDVLHGGPRRHPHKRYVIEPPPPSRPCPDCSGTGKPTPAEARP